MKNVFLMITSMAFLSGCTTVPQQTGDFNSANRVIEQSVVIPAPTPKTAYNFFYNNDPAVTKAYQQYAKTGKAPNIETKGFIQFAYGTGQQPIVSTSPLELTVISLEPGESVTNISSGDPTRWSYSLAYSGQGAMKQAHVMIKPSYPNISTDLVITTSKRIYTIKMVSDSNGKYARDIRFWYPEEAQAYWNNYNDKQLLSAKNSDMVAKLPNLTVGNLNFAYKITGSGLFNTLPSWAPTRVFDDGTHTYVQFPSNITSRDLPALFVQSSSGDNELVNYRVKYPYFVVDKIFNKAVLIMGVGIDQSKVTLINQRYK